MRVFSSPSDVLTRSAHFVTLQLQTPTLIPLSTPTPLGPWTITVTEGISGDEAISMLNEKNPENPDVSELPGADPETSYVLARITVQNMSSVQRVINLADFAATGADGILRRPPTIEVPDPALQTIVPAGETIEGIVPFLVDDPDVATIWFDSVLLGGNWASGVFALGSGAAIPAFEIPDANPTDAGNSVETAVAIGEPVRTGGWEVTVTDWISGQAVFDAVDYRSQALGSGFATFWHAVKATITNLNPVPSVFPNDAFLVTGDDGEPWDNVLALTPPEPDASREYLPGATREGWAAFDMSAYETDGPPLVPYVRVGINSLLNDYRYVVVGDVGAGSSQGDEAETTPDVASADAEPLDVAVGDIVVITEDLVNIRAEATTDVDPIEELPLGTELEITGDPVEADGYRWYPVKEVDGDLEGFVVQDFMEVWEE
jgi:hypothetical protein